ncbi:MAG TPA: hypothetical protein VGC42_29800 [Kofleriaceae bacterium]
MSSQSTQTADPALRGLIDQAFDYRGYVTVSKRDGSKLVGFIYDRTPSQIELFDEAGTNRIVVPVADILTIELTGEDTAAKAQKIWERRISTLGSLEAAETSKWGEWEEHSVLILVALPTELRVVAKVLGAKVRGNIARGRLGDTSAVAIAVGMGGMGAAKAVEAERPHLVISCGLAGGLDAVLAPGDVVLASSVRDEAGDSLAPDPRVLTGARAALGGAGGALAEGELWCGTEVAVTAQDKRALAAPGRLAIDLESWAAANAAAKAGIPWLAFRVVIDSVDTDLPEFTREQHESYVVPALRHALRGPRAIKQLVQLGQQARTAGQALEAALRRLAPAVHDVMHAGAPAGQVEARS